MRELDINEHLSQNNLNSIRHKINNIINLKQFCGICLEGNDSMHLLNDDLEIIVQNITQTVSMKDVIYNVFSDNLHILASDNICSNCTTQLLQAYIFIQNTKTLSKLVNTYIDDLSSKLVDINQHLGTTSKLDSSNIVIVLENPNLDSQIPFETIEKATDNVLPKTTVKTEGIEHIFQCDECNIFLPNSQAWNKHNSKYHSNKIMECFKSSKNHQYLVADKVHAKVKCKICHQIISDADLIHHLKEYHEEASQLCHICSEGYNSSKALEMHIKTCHENSGSNKCIMCLKSFDDSELREHNCKFKCPECVQMPCIHYKYLMFYREQILRSNRAKCLDCEYVCRKKENLLAHVNQEHLNHHPFTCDVCEQQFYSKTSLKAHIYNFHLDTFTCKFCDKRFHTKSSYDSHKECCEMVTKENDCAASFDSRKEEHRKHNKVIYPCGLCSKELPTESKRRQHMAKAHSGIQINNPLSNQICVICEEEFDTKRELVRHMHSHGPNVKFPCRTCNTEYETLRKLKAHSRKHIGPFAVCEVCGKEMRQVLLDKHMSNHATAGETVTCNTCGKSFLNIKQLKYHQKEHLDSVPCPKCKKLFNPAKLRRHWRGHMMTDNPKLKESRKQRPHLKCELCDYMTWNNILLECHMNRHHLKIKPYVCHICSKDFIGKHLLKRHLETHTVDKSVSCMICGKNFSNSTCLKMHLRLHTGETPYTCDICGQKFRSSSIMNVHKVKKHSDRSNTCPLCPSKFHTIRDMRRHVIKVHWKQKNRRFDPRELKGLDEEHYHLFHDGRRVKIDEKNDFFMRKIQ